MDRRGTRHQEKVEQRIPRFRLRLGLVLADVTDGGIQKVDVRIRRERSLDFCVRGE
jgi:hypothetical protein